MVWGKAGSTGMGDLVKRLTANDPALKSLTILKFRRLDDEDVAQLCEALQANTALQDLTCISHVISCQAAASMGNMLQLNKSLLHLNIGNSKFGDEALTALVDAGLHLNSSLRSWDLEHKGLSQVCVKSIGRVLQQHTALQHLQLSRNAISDAGLQQLCAIPWAALRQVEVAKCGITHQGLQSLAAAFSLPQLTHLDLSHNTLGPEAADSLALLLTAAKQMQELRLKSTALGDAGVAGVARALPNAAALQVLDLSYTGVSSQGLSAMAVALPQQAAAAAGFAASSNTFVGLSHILLAGNSAINDTSVVQVAKGLQAAAAAAAAAPGRPDSMQAAAAPQANSNSPSYVLDLAASGVGVEGIRALAEAPGLSQLRLFACKLGGNPGHSCSALVESISNGKFAGLKELNIIGCDLQLEQLTAIMKAVATNGCLPQLNTLELGANPGVQADGFEEQIGSLRSSRPGLDVHWRVADSDNAPDQ